MDAAAFAFGLSCVLAGVCGGLLYHMLKWRGLALHEQRINRQWEQAFAEWQADVARFNSSSIPKPKRPTFKVEAAP